MIIVVIFLCLNFSLSVCAISDSCVEDHFNKLVSINDYDNTIILTPPSENTCPYVAMSLLLSFYDAYWNDRFVAEEYEWEQGEYNVEGDSLNITFAPIEEAEDWADYVSANVPEGQESYPYYRNYVLNNTANFLEPYLISIGIQKGYHPESDETLGLKRSEIVNVLSHYIHTTIQFDTSEVSVRYLEGDLDDLVTVIKQQLNKGFPVIYGGSRQASTEDQEYASSDISGKPGHAMIAYAEIQNGNDIQLHTGWSGEEHNDTIYTTKYNIDPFIIWLEIDEEKVPHTHSYSYVDSKTGENLCACQIYSTHPAHSQNHKYFTRDDTEKRYEMCACGDIRSILHYHEKFYSNRDSVSHYERCGLCNYNRPVYHSFTFDSITSTNHEEICECGYVKTSVHTAFRYVKHSQLKHKMYCSCGYYMGLGSHSVVTDSPTQAHCIDCGAVFNPMNDFILLEKDPEYIIE